MGAFGGSGGEGVEGFINSGVNDNGVAVVDFGDAVGDGVGVGDEGGDVVVLFVEGAEAGDDGGEGEAFGGEAREVLVFHAPDVTHGGVAVAEVGDVFVRRGDAFGDGVGDGDDEVGVGVELEGADGGGEEGEVVAVGGGDVGEVLKEGGLGDAGVDVGMGGVGDVEEGGDLGIGEEMDELEEDFFAAAEAGEPVVDELDAEGGGGGGHGG